jgi:hypothetical protein
VFAKPGSKTMAFFTILIIIVRSLHAIYCLKRKFPSLNIGVISDILFHAEPDVLKEVKQNLDLGSVKFEVGYIYST